jgi:hypothetical protein
MFALCINSGIEFFWQVFDTRFEWLAGYVYVLRAEKLPI